MSDKNKSLNLSSHVVPKVDLAYEQKRREAFTLLASGRTASADIDDLRTQLADATRKLEEARKDAERYRWWRSNAWFYRSCHLLQDCWPKYGEIVAKGFDSKEAAIDFAIDQAIEQGKGVDES
jgi:hypothetical protein